LSTPAQNGDPSQFLGKLFQSAFIGQGNHVLRSFTVTDPKPRYCDLVLHAVTLAFDEHGFSVAQDPIQCSAGEGAVIVEDFGLVFMGLVGGQHGRALLTPPADDLEEQVRASFVDGQIAQFVHGHDGGFECEISLSV